MYSSRTHHRRGVVLLIVLGLLTMFGLVAMAFVMLASQSATTARTHQQMDEVTVSPEDELTEAIMQVLRGSTGNSALQYHSLLEDLYGHSITTGSISGASPVAGGQLFAVTIPNARQWVGGVLTMTRGPAAGQSTRIVGVNPSSPGTALAIAFDGPVTVPPSGQFIINGRPFSGTGFGDGAGGLNPLSINPDQGAANEDYDAVDYQNWLLAAVIDTNGDGRVDGVIPSLHRPAVARALGADNNPQSPNATVMRPTIPGTNFPADWDGNLLNNTGNSWDVDNDGDGIADSVWVDLGLPARSDEQGRLVKPLFAILCVDLDGRLNLNAHGSLAQVEADYYELPTAAGGYDFADATGLSALPRGQGIGPADVNLSPLFTDDGQIFPQGILPTDPRLTQLEDLLAAPSTAPWPGRYGQNRVPGFTGADALCLNRWFEYDGSYWGGGMDSYGSPPDPFGTVAMGLDVAGRPLWRQTIGGSAAVGQPLADNPYEFNPTYQGSRGMLGNATGGADTPFGPSELERVLRCFDRDAHTLPPRLLELTADQLVNRRHEVTTESWDMPVPGTLIDPTNGQRYATFVELLSGRGIPQAQWSTLFDQDLLAGRRMNINRPLGNAADDDGDNIVDEAGETGQLQFYTTANGGMSTIGMQYDPTRTATSANCRQLFARHLYCLAMLLTPPHDQWSVTDPDFDAEDRAQLLAQWAVNVVDFRDTDSIMTRFPYDVNPWDGWSPPGTEEYTVWGCERPELLISETLAFHDRRTEDTDEEVPSEAGKEPKRTDAVDPDDPDQAHEDRDEDFDQRFKPQGSLFIELFNPWTDQEPRSGDLYQNGGVDLDAVAGGSSPVWRMVITSNTSRIDPDAPDSTTTFERSVYFTTADPGLNDDGTAFYTESGAPTEVAPGRYVVIGPGEPNGGTTETPIGWPTGANAPPGEGTGRRIALNPGGGSEVQVYADGSSDDLTSVSIQDASAVVVNSPQRLSISEPIGGYTDAGPGGSGAYKEDTGYPKPYDVPLDKAGDLWDEIKLNELHPNVRMVYLQRLANPLVAHDPDTNPYRTIDSMPIDLTTFNGVSDEDNKYDGADSDLKNSDDSDINFFTRERGENNGGNDNIWKVESTGTTPDGNTNYSTPSGYRFESPLHHTLGYLNDPFGQPRGGPANHIADPEQPFPWLTWNSRPFVSAAEVMLVPTTSLSQLLRQHSLATGDAYDSINAPFQHLPSFFNSGVGGGGVQLHRILELLTVPSRFTGAQLQGNPAAFVSGTNHPFPPPFHFVPTYREPGKVNLNTVFSRRVFNGLMNGFGGGLWDNFVASRRGYGNGDNQLALDGSIPTRFARPFRSPGAYNLRAGSATPTNGSDREVEATLLRGGGGDPATPNRPLFSRNSAADIDDTDRNPYFRYQGIMRLPNLVTTRSNVYAVWITVGYFNVNGNSLGTEAGSETGEVKRHRAFYIVDRSIPVGFQRGQDNNVEKAILLRRWIE